LKLDQALEKFITPSINYDQKYFLEAEKFIIKHYDIKIPSIHDNTLFLSSTATY
ncbi:1859_t:CDS:2, partial [Cetraspora pellucida]